MSDVGQSELERIVEQTYTLYILYLILFRLAIITAGIVSIVLGYKLFVKGVFSDGSGGTGVEAGVGALRLTMRNAAPGSVFALFGVIVIGVMFIKDAPNLSVENVRSFDRGPEAETQSVRNESMLRSRVTMRGEDDPHAGLPGQPSTPVEQSSSHEELVGSMINAIDTYEKAVKDLAFSTNNLAWMYYKKSMLDEALAHAEIAVRLVPDANYLDTQGRILFEKKRFSEAIEVMERAAKLDPKLVPTLEKFRQDRPE